MYVIVGGSAGGWTNVLHIAGRSAVVLIQFTVYLHDG